MHERSDGPDQRDEGMYAVIRETTYDAQKSLHETRQFQEFQRAHANLNGYEGTLVVDVGAGRYLTLTLWRTKQHMTDAREAMGPVVERTLNPIMTAPTRLLGTGPVVVSDWNEPPE